MRGERLVIAGGCLLAFGAAFVNTTFLLETGASVSHLTGDIAKLAVDVTVWRYEMLVEAMRVGIATMGFLGGAFAAGFLIHHPTLDFSRPYGRTVSVVGVLLGLASMFVDSAPELSIALGSLGCGLQNAIASHYRGLVLRTTHLTGMFTDLGVTLGMRLRGHRIPAWKVLVPVFIIGAFFLGGISAAVLSLGNYRVLAIASGGYLAAGLGWSFCKHWGRFKRSG